MPIYVNTQHNLQYSRSHNTVSQHPAMQKTQQIEPMFIIGLNKVYSLQHFIALHSCCLLSLFDFFNLCLLNLLFAGKGLSTESTASPVLADIIKAVVVMSLHHLYQLGEIAFISRLNLNRTRIIPLSITLLIMTSKMYYSGCQITSLESGEEIQYFRH